MSLLQINITIAVKINNHRTDKWKFDKIASEKNDKKMYLSSFLITILNNEQISNKTKGGRKFGVVIIIEVCAIGQGATAYNAVEINAGISPKNSLTKMKQRIILITFKIATMYDGPKGELNKNIPSAMK